MQVRHESFPFKPGSFWPKEKPCQCEVVHTLQIIFLEFTRSNTDWKISHYVPNIANIYYYVAYKLIYHSMLRQF